MSRVTSQTNVLSSKALRRLVQSLCPKWQVAELDQFSHLPGGYSNRNYRFTYQQQEFVLRVPGATEANFQMERNWLSDWAREYAPEVVAFDTSIGALITRFIQLPLLAEQKIPVSELIEFLRFFHSSFPENAPYPNANLNNLIKNWLAASKPNSELMRLFPTLPRVEAEMCVCHNDLNPWNILIDEQSPKSWRVLDWEMAGLNDPLFDLVCLHEGVAQHTSFDKLLNGYYGANKPNSQDIHATVRRFWFREYAWAINQIELGNDIPAIRDQAEDFERRLLNTI